jgi:hypothetical protein
MSHLILVLLLLEFKGNNLLDQCKLMWEARDAPREVDIGAKFSALL